MVPDGEMITLPPAHVMAYNVASPLQSAGWQTDNFSSYKIDLHKEQSNHLPGQYGSWALFHISLALAVGAQNISTPIFMVQNRLNDRLKSSILQEDISTGEKAEKDFEIVDCRMRIANFVMLKDMGT
ncbi:hypothetical protein OIU78_002317 [Salix suchowensis]|nr:hypothetical protein OIU78_002317 [Salix suchowensis]